MPIELIKGFVNLGGGRFVYVGKEFREEDHPRGEDGRFIDAGGSEGEQQGVFADRLALHGAAIDHAGVADGPTPIEEHPTSRQREGDAAKPSDEPIGGHLGDVQALSTGGRNPSDVEKFNELKTRWAEANNKLLDYIDHPDAPEAKALLEEQKAITKEMYTLDADPGGIEGIGLPGGPRDVVIIGSGPSGMAAGIMAGTDGLDTLLIDADTRPGGQSKDSSRIENYMGFPIGITGAELASRSFEQIQRLKVEAELGIAVTGMTYDHATGLKTLTLSDGRVITARSVVFAGGILSRKLDVEGADSSHVVYGDPKQLQALATGGKSVVILGGSNGAAQAALGVAKVAGDVTVVSRSPISKGMSDYQVTQVHSHPRMTVVEGAEVQSIGADTITTKTGQTIKADAVGVFIGGVPNTQWLPPTVERATSRGKPSLLIKVANNLETSMPGVFAVGDVRSGSTPRVGTAAADGQMAIFNVFDYLKKLQAEADAANRTGRKEIRKSVVHRTTRQIAEWNRWINDIFAVDEDNPYWAQTVDPEPDNVVNKAFNEEEHPRDDHGRFTDGAGGHEGPEWKQKTDENGRPIPIKVSNVDDAVGLVLEGKVVEIPDVRTVFTLIDKLATIATAAKAAGKDAPKYDLCQISVPGTNLFCASKVRTSEHPQGVPRIAMPQLAGTPVPGSAADKLPKRAAGTDEVDVSNLFIEFLRDRGIATEHHEVPAAHLRASQAELVGPKVAAMMADRSFDPANAPIFVSRDSYVVDGHHRWAAVVGRDAEDGILGDARMRTIRIDAPITEVLRLANKFTKDIGIAPAAGNKKKTLIISLANAFIVAADGTLLYREK